MKIPTFLVLTFDPVTVAEEKILTAEVADDTQLRFHPESGVSAGLNFGKRPQFKATKPILREE